MMRHLRETIRLGDTQSANLTSAATAIALLIFGLFLAGCGEPASTSGPAASSSQSSEPEYYVKSVGLDDADLFRDLGLEKVRRFDVKAPPDTTVTIWLETYENRKLVRDLTWGLFYTLFPGNSPEEFRVRWTQYRPPTPEQPETRKMKWTIGIEGGLTTSGTGWIERNHHALQTSAGGALTETNVELGKTYVLAARGGQLGDKETTRAFGSEEELKEVNDVVVMLKCRFKAADPNRTSSESGNFSGRPK